MQTPVETEVKIRIQDPAAIRKRLLAAGFTVAVERLFEANNLYDRAAGELRSAGMVLRLRQVGEKNVVTWKGRGEPGPHKSRPEIETTVGSAEVLAQIFERIGFSRSFLYEKFRTELHRTSDQVGMVTIDETPIGSFIELEGPAEWI